MMRTASTPPASAIPDVPADSLHADLRQRVVLHAADALWQPTATPGVQRRVLDQLGTGPACTTTLVRYAPGVGLPRQAHGVGEEILVLEGVLCDETGDHPAGTYLRNPPGTARTRSSPPGCLLFVKLWQCVPGDTASVRINTLDAALWQPGMSPGLSTLLLHCHAGARTLLLRSAPHTWYDTHSHPGGEELLVLDGVLHDDMGRYPRHSWIRNPRWSRHAPHTGDAGALSFVKVGYLGLWDGQTAAQAPGAAAAPDV